MESAWPGDKHVFHCVEEVRNKEVVVFRAKYVAHLVIRAIDNSEPAELVRLSNELIDPEKAKFILDLSIDHFKDVLRVEPHPYIDHIAEVVYLKRVKRHEKTIPVSLTNLGTLKSEESTTLMLLFSVTVV